MKILFIQWGVFGTMDMEEAFMAEGHMVVRFPFSKDQDVVYNFEVEKELTSVLHKEVPDVVFSFDFFLVISAVCEKEDIRYISWVFDDPWFFYIQIWLPIHVTAFMFLINNYVKIFMKKVSLPFIICLWRSTRGVWMR